MNKILLTLILSVGLTIYAYAEQKTRTIQPMGEHTIQKMDRKFNQHKTVKRDFRTQKEFEYRNKRNISHRKSGGVIKDYHRYDNGYAYNDRYRENYRPMRQRGFNYTKRGWVLAYRYDRAEFYDNLGYHYGYFNRYGFYFENVFYRYDRYYTYKDRVRGRGLFDHKYYMPANSRYYGFTVSHYNQR